MTQRFAIPSPEHLLLIIHVCALMIYLSSTEATACVDYGHSGNVGSREKILLISLLFSISVPGAAIARQTLWFLKQS